MLRCVALSAEAAREGNEPFGALLTVDGTVRATSKNRVITERDPTRHAELQLVSDASRLLERSDIERSILYTSTEPCAMCCGAIYWAGIPTVVYGCSALELGKLTGGSFVLPSRDLFRHGRRRVAVVGPVLERDALEVHRAYWSTRRPVSGVS